MVYAAQGMVGVGDMIVRARLVIEAMYEAWAAGDLPRAMSSFAQHVVFAVRAPARAQTYLGNGCSRREFQRRIEAFLGEFKVAEFEVLNIVPSADGWQQCRVRYRYVHKRTGMDIDGTMRHDLRIDGDRVVQFMVSHDAERMGAFFQLVARERVGA